jgi:hypothetical protein
MNGESKNGKSFDQYHNEPHEDKLVEIPTSSQTEISDGAKDTADYIDRHIIESMKELAKEGFKPKLSEISDEEIEKVANTLGDDYYASELIMWEKGAKWYREQLKQK